MPQQNSYTKNETLNATPNPVIPNPDSIDEAFIATANDILMNIAELTRKLIGAHQSAVAIVINKDWIYARKYFSLSEKYAALRNMRINSYYGALTEEVFSIKNHVAFNTESRKSPIIKM